jgi:hypothetical protein
MRGPEQHHSETKKFVRTETEEAPVLFPASIAVKKFSAAMRGRESSHRIARAMNARVDRCVRASRVRAEIFSRADDVAHDASDARSTTNARAQRRRARQLARSSWIA